MARALAVAAVAASVASVSGLYFHVTEGTPRCFIEEVPADTLIVGNYKSPDFIPWPQPGFNGVGVKVEVKSPTGGMVMSKMTETAGRFAFTSQLGGEYHLCFNTNSSRWFGQPKKFRIDLRLDVGETGIDYEEVAKKEHLTDLEIEIRRLNDKVRDISREQAYQREREVAFRDTSESTNSRVKWWSVLQTLVMVATAVFQVVFLRAFFAKKLKGGSFGPGAFGARGGKTGSAPSPGMGGGASGSRPMYGGMSSSGSMGSMSSGMGSSMGGMGGGPAFSGSSMPPPSPGGMAAPPAPPAFGGAAPPPMFSGAAGSGFGGSAGGGFGGSSSGSAPAPPPMYGGGAFGSSSGFGGAPGGSGPIYRGAVGGGAHQRQY